MTAYREGITRENIGPYSHAALGRILRLCPAIRSVQMRTNAESGIPNEQQVEFYRDYVFPAIRDAGREVRLDLRAWAVAGGMIAAAQQVRVPLRVSTKYWAEDLGRPYQPAETYAGYSYLNFLKSRALTISIGSCGAWARTGCCCGATRIIVRRAVPTFRLSGFERLRNRCSARAERIRQPARRVGRVHGGQKTACSGSGSSSATGCSTLLWGRLSYDPKTPEAVWTSELERRFGAAAARRHGGVPAVQPRAQRDRSRAPGRSEHVHLAGDQPGRADRCV